MARKHAFILAIALGLAATVGAVAAVNTAQLGKPQAKASTVAVQSAALQKRTRLLDRQEAALKQAFAKRPPKLPKVPKFAPVAMPAPAPVQVSTPPAPASAPPAAAPAPPQRVEYRRAAPVVVVKHRSHDEEGEGEHSDDQERSGGGDDSGGGDEGGDD
jgi:uncharacterized membrane protein YgcG